MGKNILITGISGFAGSYLTEHLIATGEEAIFGTYLTQDSLINLESVKDKVKVHKVDLLHKEDVQSLVNSVQPSLVYHLAALTSAGDSFRNPAETITQNASIEINLLEALRKTKPDCKILVVSSAQVYGRVDKKDLPIDEQTLFCPTNPYAVSKITQDFLAFQYFLSYKLSIVRIRPFNHTGPRQSSQFVVSAFARKIAELEKSQNNVIKVGNLEPKRDFTDVRDIVKAYVLLMEKGIPGEVYNVGSGVSYSIRDILNKLLAFAKKEMIIEQDPLLLRPSDTPEFVCDNAKMRGLTGWTPKIPLEQTLKETLDYWRNII